MPGPALARSKRISRWDSTRIYDVGGREYPSVTSVIGMMDKPALVPWAAKMAAEYAVENREAVALLDDDDAVTLIKSNWRKQRDKAANFGTDVHKYIEDGVTPEDTRAAAYVASAGVYLEEHVTQVISQETTIVNVDEGYAGTADLFALQGHEFFVADWKSGSGLYESAAMQLVALSNGTHYVNDDGTLVPITEWPYYGHGVRLTATGYELKTVRMNGLSARLMWKAFTGLIPAWHMKVGGDPWDK